MRANASQVSGRRYQEGPGESRAEGRADRQLAQRAHQCRRVKRWRQGDHRERWAGSALLLAESKFRRLKGYREISKLVSALDDYGIKKGLAVKARTA